MMRLKTRDLIATLLVLAIAVPYIGYLVRGEMPFIQDPRGMSATGLILGAAAYVAFMTGDRRDRIGVAELGLAGVSLTLGLAALVFAEAAAAELLLAMFMVSIGIVWAVEMVDHAGAMPGQRPAGLAS
jgi:hypothetical protein